MSAITLIVLMILTGAIVITGILVIGVFIGLQFNLKTFLDRQEKVEIKKANKKRDSAVYAPQMSDKEAKEKEDNSISKINTEVYQHDE